MNERKEIRRKAEKKKMEEGERRKVTERLDKERKL